MSRRTRRVVALVALCVAASMALGVGSYSSVSAERDVSVSVVAGDKAYLGLDEDLTCGPGSSATKGTGQSLIRNQFSSDIDRIELRVTALGGYVRVRAKRTPKAGPAEPLGPDESTRIVFNETYGAGESIYLEIYGPTGHGTKEGAERLQVEVVEATGPGVRVTDTDRTYDVNCPDQKHPPKNGTEDD
ncbi:hypothetical protein DU504_14385 [Haloplanus salinus]|uniref:DUF1102 domain-containing protein n=1 Tax=Haloplanus salinus TaxID=1126245 RepID=A0A368NFD7_9EURY|nr:hypothetical protein [Haloplanus salinus]RCU48385.1 hypothetical protein DU504_14385 [Haloplanus salinus]